VPFEKAPKSLFMKKGLQVPSPLGERVRVRGTTEQCKPKIPKISFYFA
jgi:hypothetical protein